MDQLRGIGMTSQRTRDRLVARLREQGIRHAGVLEVMRNTPRHIFVDEALASRAYEDTALPIGHGQTISQPLTVARMTEVLITEQIPGKVLEVGTGSGYQAAVLAQLVARVFTVERIEALSLRARANLRLLNLRNVMLRYSDGSEGWVANAPYDAILVAAAPPEVPMALCQQLAIGGRLVIPVGKRGAQELLCVTRGASGFESRVLESASFVPLVGGLG